MINIKKPGDENVLSVSKNAFKTIYEFNGYEVMGSKEKSAKIEPEVKKEVIKPVIEPEVKKK